MYDEDEALWPHETDDDDEALDEQLADEWAQLVEEREQASRLEPASIPW